MDDVCDGTGIEVGATLFVIGLPVRMRDWRFFSFETLGVTVNLLLVRSID